ncbi:fumarate reductase flavoprotein subunit [Lactobacillus colini]|uniref:Urocanate reductase n=1 Tax=Lactobacillus colini TaxID=1819254 RepID=A0ABS4MB25_9LACO|nr:FAD-dependent oxidoreductase [Lactobacillus colini]MBP2056877.1 fumarate reductase flavoprotein subunit [Lactobacillus colini]
MKKEIIKTHAKGKNGQIDFDIDVTDNHINDIKVTKSFETPAIFNQVFTQLKQNILDKQTFDVDAISGASIMTKAITESGSKALRNSNITPRSNHQAIKYSKTILNTDVAVIGSGIAGLMAACRALSMGKKVIVLEKNGYLGGATILNGSNVVATGSKVAENVLGKEAKKDSKELLVRDITRESSGTNYLDLSKLLANNIGLAVDFISKFAGLTYQKSEIQTIEHSVDRQIEMPSESSYELIMKVAKAFQKKGGKILLDARVEELNKDNNGNLVSLVAEGKHKSIQVNFKSLILAAGGWGARDYKAKKTDIPYYGPMTSTGDYFDFAKNMNLVTRNLDWYKVYPHGIEVQPGIAKLTTYSTKAVSDMGAIFINQNGNRIVNESAPYTHFRDAINKQKNKTAYIIMDQRMWNKFYDVMLRYGFTAGEVQSFFNLDGKKSPVLVKGNLQTVAKKANINYSNLLNTLENYSKYVKAKRDSEFGRDPKFMHLYQGNTYYIIEQKLRFCTTLGGYETNKKMQLLDTKFNTVNNFYAAGEIIGGANGHDSMPSMMNSWAYASGFVAGTSAADNCNY